jgi:hypothetical protein
MTAATQWLERTLDDSANRRLSIPDSFLSLDGALVLAENVAAGLTGAPAVIREISETTFPSWPWRPCSCTRSSAAGTDRSSTSASAGTRSRRRPDEGRRGERPGRSGRRGRRLRTLGKRRSRASWIHGALRGTGPGTGGRLPGGMVRPGPGRLSDEADRDRGAPRCPCLTQSPQRAPDRPPSSPSPCCTGARSGRCTRSGRPPPDGGLRPGLRVRRDPAPTHSPRKGEVLTLLTAWWLDRLGDSSSTTSWRPVRTRSPLVPALARPDARRHWARRALLVRRTRPLSRGVRGPGVPGRIGVAGVQAHGTLAGEPLPRGWRRARNSPARLLPGHEGPGGARREHPVRGGGPPCSDRAGGATPRASPCGSTSSGAEPPPSVESSSRTRSSSSGRLRTEGSPDRRGHDPRLLPILADAELAAGL